MLPSNVKDRNTVHKKISPPAAVFATHVDISAWTLARCFVLAVSLLVGTVLAWFVAALCVHFIPFKTFFFLSLINLFFPFNLVIV